MHIRRALLLFAIVLGMSALVASLSRPPDERSRTTATAPTPGPGTVAAAPSENPPRAVRFDAASRERRRVSEERAATLEVTVDQPGSVEVPDLGLSASADEHTPARFEVFPTRAGNYAILFTPAAGDESRPAGTLVVKAEE